MNGKIAVLDLPDQHSMTFYHYVEEALRVEYRYHKWFHGQYTDWDGVEQRRSFSLFVRDIERGVRTDVYGMEEILWQEGLYKGNRPGAEFGVRTIEAARLFDAVSHVIQSGRAKGLLYSTTAT
jgi:aminoglycoside 3-N-acetyltransferase